MANKATIVQALAERVGLGPKLAGSARDWKRRLVQPKLGGHGIELEDLEATKGNYVNVDWVMSDLSGLEMCRRLRADPRMRDAHAPAPSALGGVDGDGGAPLPQ